MTLLLKKFNLIVSTYRNREDECISEVWYFLKEFGARVVEASKTGLPGLVVINTDLDPLEVVDRMRSIAEERPWEFQYILKVVPIEITMETDLDKIRKATLEMCKTHLKKDETYMVDANIRLSEIGRKDVIEAIAPYINNKVDLTKPMKVIRVEIIGDVTGISIIEPKYILSIARMKRRR